LNSWSFGYEGFQLVRQGDLFDECIRPAAPASLEEARRLVAEYVKRYNHVRLNSAIGYLTPADKLNGFAQVIFDERDR
jgi:putative transposase